MTGYQTFPYRPGSSDSLNKLTQLKILPLTAKSFLDVGCNEGFFCGYALFDGARKVVGIDINEKFINSARQNFPGCDFRSRAGMIFLPTKNLTLSSVLQRCIMLRIKRN